MTVEPGVPEVPGIFSQFRQSGFATLAERAEEHRQTLMRLAAESAETAAILGELAGPATDRVAVQQLRQSEACLSLAAELGDIAQRLNQGIEPGIR